MDAEKLRATVEDVIYLIYHYSFTDAEKLIVETDSSDDYWCHIACTCLKSRLEKFRDKNIIDFYKKNTSADSLKEIDDKKLETAPLWLQVLILCTISENIPYSEREKILERAMATAGAETADKGPYLLALSLLCEHNLYEDSPNALSLDSRRLDILRSSYRESDWRFIATLIDSSLVCGECDKKSLSLERAEEAATKAEEHLAADDALWITIFERLYDIHAYDNHDKACDYISKAWELCKKILPPGNQKRFDILEAYEVGFMHAGHIEKAVSAYEEELKACSESCPGDNMAIAKIYSSLASILDDSDNERSLRLKRAAYEAIKKANTDDYIVLRYALPVSKSCHSLKDEKGENDVQLDFLFYLAEKYGPTKKAAIAFKESYAKNFVFSGPPMQIVPQALARLDRESELYLSLLSEYGVYVKQKYGAEKAIPYYKEAIELAENYFGAQTYEMAVCKSNLAIAYNELGKTRLTKNLLGEAVAIMDVLDCNDHSACLFRRNLGVFHADDGEHDKAIPLLKKAYEGYSALEEWTDTAFTARELAQEYQKSGEKAKSLELFREAYNLYLRESGEKDRETCEALVKLATAEIDNALYVDARIHAQNAYNLEKKERGGDSSEAGYSLYILACAYHFLKCHNDAAKAALKAIRILEEHDEEGLVKAAYDVAIASYSALGNRRKAEALIQEKREYR